MLRIEPYSSTNQLIKCIIILLNIVFIIKGYFNEHYYIGLLFTLPAAYIIFTRMRHKKEDQESEKLGKHSYLYFRNNLKKTHL